MGPKQTDHEVGYIRKGWLRKKYAGHCNTCGWTGPWWAEKTLAIRNAMYHRWGK